MRYPIAIEPGAEATAFGIVVPDLPGCFSAGDTLDEAMQGAEEAVAGWTLGVVTIDPTLLDDTTEYVNIALPRRVLSRLDALAKAANESRSGYIAQLTLQKP